LKNGEYTRTVAEDSKVFGPATYAAAARNMHTIAPATIVFHSLRRISRWLGDRLRGSLPEYIYVPIVSIYESGVVTGCRV
jgi:hypothetical protein